MYYYKFIFRKVDDVFKNYLLKGGNKEGYFKNLKWFLKIRKKNVGLDLF